MNRNRSRYTPWERKATEISEQKFDRLLKGARLVGSNEGGSTYRTTGGKLFSMEHDGSRYRFYIINEE